MNRIILTLFLTTVFSAPIVAMEPQGAIDSSLVLACTRELNQITPISIVHISFGASNQEGYYNQKIAFLESLKKRTDGFQCTEYKPVSYQWGIECVAIHLAQPATLGKISEAYRAHAKKGNNPITSMLFSIPAIIMETPLDALAREHVGPKASTDSECYL